MLDWCLEMSPSFCDLYWNVDSDLKKPLESAHWKYVPVLWAKKSHFWFIEVSNKKLIYITVCSPFPIKKPNLNGK